ncbi:MAG: cell wall hydrolase [Defluviitaleaceae bacterium]|nr:cell wall hydrolase [Defluviitaleaceae bacterium]
MTQQQTWTRTDLTASQRSFVAVVAGESLRQGRLDIGDGGLSWQATANVIMNRLDNTTSRSFGSFTTLSSVMNRAHFSAVGGPQYRLAMNYLTYGIADAYVRPHYQDLINTILPIYYRMVPDITGGAHYFYSPHLINSPGWVDGRLASGEIEEIFMSGINSDYFRFFRYVGLRR